ncbi:hypothetical protein J8F10_24425 [Gemmata sp. G18]|uniref:TraD/TraG TraM recognition site domain-containing protein n=1 Tax=Gemmata palustris TaxID=2822762 RepID=A0ABS5BZT0_9BACT|nr:hypothetical protein [Gemmata palustris]MBP3958408.1 hypothetical protein [Gemmata palustris]
MILNRLRRRKPVETAGIPLSLEELGAHVLVLGTTGNGKSFSTRGILKAFMRAGHPMVFVAAKQTEPETVLQLCREVGCEHRFMKISPHGPHKLHLLKHLLSYKDAYGAAEFLDRVKEIGTRGEKGKHDPFFGQLTTETTQMGIRLPQLVGSEPTLEDLMMVVKTSPPSLEVAASEAFVEGKMGLCSQLIAHASEHYRKEDEHDLKSVLTFFMQTFAGIGEKARSAPLADLTGSVGRLTSGAFRGVFDTETTVDFDAIERERKIVVLDAPIVPRNPTNQMFQAIWLFCFQEHALRRDPRQVDKAIVLVRDECQELVHASWDASVTAVARSQKLIHFDLTQHVSGLKTAFGGEGTTPETMSFIANHATVLGFGNNCHETNRLITDLIGQKRTFQFSGGGGKGGEKPTGWYDQALGVSGGGVHWSETYLPHVRPEEFLSLPRGVAVMISAGRTFNGLPYHVCDFRE